MARFLILSDLHLHPWGQYSTVSDDGYNSRLMDQAGCLDQVVNYAVDNNIEDLLFGGDFFHTNGTVSAQALTVAKAFISRLRQNGLRWNTLVGNHDYGNRAKTINSISWMSLYSKVNIALHPYPVVFTADNCRVGMLSYTDNEKVIEEFFKREMDIAIMHQGVTGVPMASGFVLNEILSPQMIPAGIKHVFTGHYHAHNRVSSNLTVIGSMNHLNWADAGTARGFLDVTVEGSAFSIKQIETKAPRFCNVLYGQELPKVENCWIRVYGAMKDLGTITEDVRKDLLGRGALSVEFDLETEQIDKEKIHGIEKWTDLDRLAEDYGKQAPNDHTREYGNSIRSTWNKVGADS